MFTWCLYRLTIIIYCVSLNIVLFIYKSSPLQTQPHIDLIFIVHYRTHVTHLSVQMCFQTYGYSIPLMHKETTVYSWSTSNIMYILFELIQLFGSRQILYTVLCLCSAQPSERYAVHRSHPQNVLEWDMLRMIIIDTSIYLEGVLTFTRLCRLYVYNLLNICRWKALPRRRKSLLYVRCVNIVAHNIIQIFSIINALPFWLK